MRALILLYWLLLYLPIVDTSFVVCPTPLEQLCACEQTGFNRLHIFCDNLSIDFKSLILALNQTSGIDRLTVVDSFWPVLERVTTASIRSLRIVNCSVKVINDKALVPLAQNLEELILINNSLTTLPQFGVLPKLQLLNLNYNKITIIKDAALDGLGRLRQLRLEGNKISLLSSTALIATKRSLELLDLSGNNLTSVPSNVVSNCPKLRYLDLSENRIPQIASLDFRNLPKLVELRLNSNKITKIEQTAFKNVPELHFLYLQKNYLPDLEGLDCTNDLEFLQIFDVSNNLLTQVPKVKGHRFLQQLKLDSNRITSIKKRTFAFNPALQLISLQNNQIRSLQTDSFLALDGLTMLFLGNNFITKIDGTMLRGVKKLQEIILRNNSLYEIANSTFHFVPNLKIIDLAYNRLTGIPRNLFWKIRSLFWLDLSYNYIASFERGTFTYKISNIIFTGNPIRCDNNIHWLLNYLSKNHVYTRSKNNKEIICSSNRTSDRPLSNISISKEKGRTLSLSPGKSSSTGQMMPKKLNDTPRSIEGLIIKLEKTDDSKMNRGTKKTLQNVAFSNDVQLSSPNLTLWKLFLPPNYDESKIPDEVKEALSKGDVPDFSLIPTDLKYRFLKNFQKLFNEFVKEGAKATKILNRMSNFDKPADKTSVSGTATFPVESDDESAKKPLFNEFTLYVIIAVLVFISVLSSFIVGFICYRRVTKGNDTFDKTSGELRIGPASDSDSSLAYMPGTSLIRYSPNSSVIYYSASSDPIPSFRTRLP